MGVCWGTREQDECKCGGDKDKCDFYDYVRSKSESDDKVGKISLITYCSYHPEQLAERMTDWLENILQSADIKLSKESITEQRKLLVDYFNTTIFDGSCDNTKLTQKEGLVAILTPEEFKNEMLKLYTKNDNESGYRAIHDEESDHGDADDLMCGLLEEMGYIDGVNIFRGAHKWYA